MKTFIKTFGLGAALVFALFVSQARAQDDVTQTQPVSTQPQASINTQGDNNVSFQTFYDQLASQGSWIQTNQYGYVFQPTENDPNWRPYSRGHWVNTDAGMTWVSDEPFGWATDHYGRWANLDGYGWVWVPGYTWAPAWVSWRDSDDDVGWAPLPPDSDVGIDFFTDDWDFGFHIGDDCDLAYDIGPWCYNFCPVAYIGDPDCWRHFRDPRDNFALIGHTHNVTNLNFRRDGAGRFGRVHAGGPSVAALNTRSRTPISHATLTSASGLGNAGLHGNTLAVYAPGIDPATARTARPASVSRTLATTSVNRGTDINRPLAVNSTIKPAGATAEQIHAATLAQRNVPASAKIATTNTHIARPLTQPLTSLRTDTRSTATSSNGVKPGAGAESPHVSAPSFSGESRYTGEPVTSHAAVGAGAESRFTGEPVTHHTTIAPSGESRYTGEAAMPQVSTPRRTSPTVHSSPSFSHSAPSYSSEESNHPSVFHTSAPVFHSSSSAYHPQPSFHSFAPSSQPHFGGGAPAAHFSGGGGARSFGGGGGGGHPSGGGGGGHASSGGGNNDHKH